MAKEKDRLDVTLKRVVYELPGMTEVTIDRDIEYGNASQEPLTFDVYRPRVETHTAMAPAVVFVAGYPDPGLSAMMGCRFKEMAGYVSWGQLVAATGLIGITYTNHHHPSADLAALLRYLRDNTARLGINVGRLGLWACSGNVPTALPLLMGDSAFPIRAAVLSYGPLLDLDGDSTVANGSAALGFANPAAGRAVSDLNAELPLMIVRAGRDTLPGLNANIDRFVAAALARNLPLTLVNHATGQHAFDLLDDDDVSREVVRRMLAFLHFHLVER